jgi:hypothetical protein
VATLIFDTHKAVKSLEEAGFEESQAEAVVEMVSGAVGENVATKSDLQTFEQRIDAKLGSLEQRMTIKLGALFFASAGVFIAPMTFISYIS